MRVNIDTSGHKKAPKSQNLAVGPWVITKTPVQKGLRHKIAELDYVAAWLSLNIRLHNLQ